MAGGGRIQSRADVDRIAPAHGSVQEADPAQAAGGNGFALQPDRRPVAADTERVREEHRHPAETGGRGLFPLPGVRISKTDRGGGSGDLRRLPQDL